MHLTNSAKASKPDSSHVQTPQPDGSAMRVVSPTRVWERQPGESPQAYDAFSLYMTVKEERLGGTQEVANRSRKSRALIHRWSSRWKWVERYRAYENNQLLLTERAQQTALREGARLWASRRIDTREKGFELGMKLLERARLLLDLPVYEREVRETKLINDQIVETLTVLNFQQHPRDARMLAETGLKLMRLSADMSTENLGVLNADVDLDSMTDEELDSYADKLLEIKQKTLSNGEVPGMD